MKRTIPAAALLLLLGACGQTREARTDAGLTRASPVVGRIEAIYEVRDEGDGTTVGYVEKTLYENGGVLYLVRGPDRDTGHGYMLPNNQAYRYVRIAGERTPEHESLGATTFASGARQILRYERPVVLERVTDEELLARLREREARAAADDSGPDGSAE